MADLVIQGVTPLTLGKKTPIKLKSFSVLNISTPPPPAYSLPHFLCFPPYSPPPPLYTPLSSYSPPLFTPPLFHPHPHLFTLFLLIHSPTLLIHSPPPYSPPPPLQRSPGLPLTCRLHPKLNINCFGGESPKFTITSCHS